jgi:SpoVK/Ycf46/Vps4 family AAA+-type ATPase
MVKGGLPALTKPTTTPPEGGIAVSSDMSASNTDRFKLDFLTAISASVGVYAIRTREPLRAAAVMQEIITEYAEFDLEFRMWDPIKGIGVYPSPFTFDDKGVITGRDGQVELDVYKPTSHVDNTVDPIKALNYAEADQKQALYVFQGWVGGGTNKFLSDKVQHYIRLFNIKALDKPFRFVFVLPEGASLPAEIETEIRVIDFLVPSHGELVKLFPEAMAAAPEGSWVPNYSPGDINRIVSASKGMSEMEFLNGAAVAMIALTSNFEHDDLRPLKDPADIDVDDFVKIMSDQKTEMIKRTDVLEILPTGHMADVGGFDLLKKWIARRRAHFGDAARAYGIRMPKGIIAVGPPGTGKSELAKAVASELGVPLVLMNIARIFGKYVGESEGKMGAALKMIEAQAPCVLMIDEIDKAFGGIGGPGGDGGTTQRTFGQFLTWLQERYRKPGASPVFVIATANNVEGLPPELLRPGRFDGIFACLFPSGKDRVEIMRIKLRAAGHAAAFSDDQLENIAKACDKYTGAEIEQALAEALTDAFDAGLSHPTQEMFLTQIAAQVPFSQSFPDKIERMYSWAKKFAKPSSSDADFKIEAPAPAGMAGTIPQRRMTLASKKRVGTRLDDK